MQYYLTAIKTSMRIKQYQISIKNLKGNKEKKCINKTFKTSIPTTTSLSKNYQAIYNLPDKRLII